MAEKEPTEVNSEQKTAEEPAEAESSQVKNGGEGVTRRGFFTNLTVAWVIFGAATLTSLVACLRFFFPNVLFEPSTKFRAGLPEEYGEGEVSSRWKEKQGVWIIRTNQEIYALSAICTHLGCPTNWFAEEYKFKCPCHGSGFFVDGTNFEGPAPRPLERYAISVADNGQIMVDKSKKFRKEMGEWGTPGSYIKV